MSNDKNKYKITIIEDGPYIVSGGVPLNEKIIRPNGNSYVYKEGRQLPQAETYSLCRCGKSKTLPFCDGSHSECEFHGSETATRENYLDRLEQLIEGPDLDLLDDGRCALARFCYREKADVWDLTRSSDNPDDRKEAIKGAEECPAGRLLAMSKDGEFYEPDYEPSIEILQDPEKDCSGPIAVRGKIPIVSSDGDTYEVRNRVTLCRCGESKNMPFCDGKHIAEKFKDHE